MCNDATFPTIETLGEQLGSKIGKHLDTTFRALVRHSSVVCEDGFFRVVSGEMHPLGNILILHNECDLQQISTQIDPLLHCGAPSAVVYCGNSFPSELVTQLTQQGYALAESMPAMGIDIDQLMETPLDEEYEFVRVDTGDDAIAWEEAMATGYEIPLGVARMFSPSVTGIRAATDAMTQTFAIRKDGRIVTTSVVHMADGLAGIYCVSTIPDERGRGLGAYATAEPLRIAHGLGYRTGVLQSSSAGYKVYQRLGFKDYGCVPLYVRMP